MTMYVIKIPKLGSRTDPEAFDKAYCFGYSCCRMVNMGGTEESQVESVTGRQSPRSLGDRRPSVTVDIVVIARVAGRQSILLVKRKKPPFEGRWALPGGFLNPHEPLEDAARRELWEETGITLPRIEQLCTVGTPGRDPRGWTISVVYLAIVGESEAKALHPHAGSDAREVGWFDLRNHPTLAFDHLDIVAYATGHLEQIPG